MSKINIFPNTLIITNNDTLYTLKTIRNDRSLEHVEIESKTNSTINIDLSNIYFESVAFKTNSDLGEHTLAWIRNAISSGKEFTQVSNRILTCDDELKDEYISELQFLVNKGYDIELPMSSFITVDLNYEWTPDVFLGPTGYSKEDGWLSFGSTSNYHDYTQASTAYLRFKGNGRKLQVYAGGSGRYTGGYVYNMDSETEVLRSLPNMSLPNRSSINDWANIEIDIPNDNQDHFIKFTYPARSSTYQYLDRAGFLINVKDVDVVIKDYKDKPEPTVNLTLDLNNEWSRSNITNPDPINYDMYMSASNWHKDRNDLTSSMYLVVQSNQDEYEFKFLVCADCEQYYDQVKAYEPGSETGVHENIRTWGDGAYLSNYTEVVYNPLQGNDTKRIKLSYVKAMFSSHLGNDRGFLLVPKGTPFINEYTE